MAGFGDALGGLGGFYGSLLGDLLSAGDRKRQKELLDRELAMYEGLPVDVATHELGDSAYGDIREDPALRGEQMRTLSALRDIGMAGGMDAQARSALAEAQAATAAQERGQRQAILDQFARVGGKGGNSALLASLTAQQGSAQRAGMEGLRAAGDAQARQYRALLDAGSLAGGIRGQDYGVSSDRANALDRVALYNAQNRQAVAASNADREYRRANMVGGALQGQGDWYGEQEKRKKNLGYATGSMAGRNVGTGMGWMGGGGP